MMTYMRTSLLHAHPHLHLSRVLPLSNLIGHHSNPIFLPATTSYHITSYHVANTRITKKAILREYLAEIESLRAMLQQTRDKVGWAISYKTCRALSCSVLSLCVRLLFIFSHNSFHDVSTLWHSYFTILCYPLSSNPVHRRVYIQPEVFYAMEVSHHPLFFSLSLSLYHFWKWKTRSCFRQWYRWLCHFTCLYSIIVSPQL